MSLEQQIKDLVKAEVTKQLNALKPKPLQRQAIHIKELSRITGLSIDALKGRRRRGKLKLINNSNELLVSVAEAKRFLNVMGLVLEEM